MQSNGGRISCWGHSEDFYSMEFYALVRGLRSHGYLYLAPALDLGYNLELLLLLLLDIGIKEWNYPNFLSMPT